MKTVNLTRNSVFVLAATMAFLYMGTAFDLHAQSPHARSLIDRLMATENYNRRSPRARLARTIAKDTSISPKIRVEVLTTILSHELENPYPVTRFIHGGYVTPTVYIQKQYVFGLEDIGSRAIPHLRKHLIQVKLSVQNISPSLGDLNSVDVAEMQHILCALGLLRDKDVFDDVLELLEDEEVDGYIRQMATGALENLGNKAAIPALKHALKDNSHVNFHVHSRIPGERRVFYPVREGAFGALKALGVKVKLVSENNYRVVR